RCTGCMACVVACQDQKNIHEGGQISLRTVAGFEKGPYPARPACMSMACMHCGDAPCLMTCPTGALARHPENGVVYVNPDICIGCRSCALACPFGAPKFTADGKMVKCDLCHVRVENGLQPACVHTCTTGALQFGDVDTLNQTKSRDAAIKIVKAAELYES
ncbi:MAG: 4Fe-4S dicluster domain-containing protein, partial [Desulfobacteraceae bacterium]|nr:4Fe-4S dicluster domain-containing protein [Desulfobacteraceae bacterium]